MKEKRWYKILITLVSSNPIEIIKGWYRAFILKQHTSLFSDGVKIKEVVYMAATHPECALNGFCDECGCPFLELALSDKKCKKL